MSSTAKPDYFGHYLGYRLNAPDEPDALASCEMLIEQKHLSSAGVAHGGAILSLVDFAMGAGIYLQVAKDGFSSSTVSLHLEFLKPIPEGTRLIVHSVIEHRGRSIVRLRADVFNEDGVKMACSYATYNIYRKRSE